MNLENQLHQFWDLESLGILEHKNYVKDFSDIIYPNEDLRYEAKLSFQEFYIIFPFVKKGCKNYTYPLKMISPT